MSATVFISYCTGNIGESLLPLCSLLLVLCNLSLALYNLLLADPALLIAGSQIMKRKLPLTEIKGFNSLMDTIAKDAPHYIPGVIVMSASMAANCLVIVAWRLWLVYQNRKRAKIVEAMGLTSEEAEKRGQELGAQDVTDVDNPFFR